MPTVSMRQLLEAGVHFGHQTRRWNPKMKPYIFAERNGIHIIDLAQTVKRLDAALEFVTETVARGESVLFVGTKKQAQEPVMQEAIRAGQPYVTKRWLGGMMTNFVTIRKRIGLLDQLEARQLAGDFDRLPKKEAALLTEELNKLQATLGGIRKMKRQPGAIFIVDPHRERIAVTEANKLEIPVVGTGDTNVDPDELDYIIPANDDAIRSIRLLCQLVADAAIEGARQRAAHSSAEPEAPEAASAVEEAGFDESAAADLVAQLTAGGTLSFDPDSTTTSCPAPRRPTAVPRRRRGPPRPPRRPRPPADPGARPMQPGPAARRRLRRRAGTTRQPPARPDRAPSRHRSTHPWRSPADAVKELRERTGAGMMDCKRALEETGGDMDKAVALLREKGLAAAAKKAGRDAREGLVSSYIHTGGRVGVLIEVNCETDFVARTDEFQKLVRDLAMQVAGLAPQYVDVDRIPEDVLLAKKAALAADESVQAKPEAIREKIVEGQLAKWYKEVCLLEQPFRDEDRTVRDLVTEKIATIGENIRVRRFVRYALGEEM